MPQYATAPATAAADHSLHNHGQDTHGVKIDMHTAAALVALHVHKDRQQRQHSYSSGSDRSDTHKPTSGAKSQHHQHHKDVYDSHSSGLQSAHFEFNDAAALTNYCIATGQAKANSPYWTRVLSGMLAGMFMVYAALLDLTVAGGFAADFRTAYPAVPKILGGSAFGFGLAMIMMCGGDLFTGNCMYMLAAWFAGRSTMRQTVQVFIVSFFSNLAGCLLFVYCFGYVTKFFTAATYLSWVQSVAINKVHEGFGIVVMSGIACNILVCLGIFIGSSSRSALGRFILAWIPVSVFVIIGYDHVVANMAFIPLGMYYGCGVTTYEYIAFSMIPSLIGNIIGGGFVVGALFVYLYSWSNRRYKTMSEFMSYNFKPEHSRKDELADFRYQMFHSLPRHQPEKEHAAAQPAATSNEGADHELHQRSHTASPSTDEMA